ncbi:MAG TPA: hypothetical protein VF043_12200 [Ktedonobacteraceae bacterium]
MRTSISRYFPLLLLGFVVLVLSSCASALAADPPPQVTPDTTDPSTLKVMVSISDDQNATDGKVGFTMQFATDEISDANFIEFIHGESVSCNDTPLTFNSPNYTARVTRPASDGYFTCYYVRNGKSYRFVHLKVRSVFNAYLQTNMVLSNSNFNIHYKSDKPDPELPLCQMNVTLSDSSTTTNTAFKESRSGAFQASITSLSGVGSLILTRTCFTPLKGIQTASDTIDPHAAIPLDSVDITYISTYRLYETWEPPA